MTTGTEPTQVWIDVDPDLAAKWLDYNTGNRPLKLWAIDAYARSMTAGRWNPYTMESIKFAGTQDNPLRLLDGQNRLYAVIRCGMTIKMLVAFEVPENAQDVMDSGVKRSASDALVLEGKKNGSRLAAVARLQLARELNMPIGAGKFSNDEIQEFSRRNPELDDAIQLLGHMSRQVPVVDRVADYCFWRFYLIAPEAAHEFFQHFSSGANLEVDNPILVLRRRLAGDYGAVRRIKLEEQICLVIRAWNFWRKEQRIQKLQSTSWAGKIAIPEPI